MAKQLITDMEYTLDGGVTTITGSGGMAINSGNQAQLASGIIGNTIRAIGSVGWRVKAKDGNPPSAWQFNTVAFNINPTVSFSQPSAMTVGDPDQTLTFSTTNPNVTPTVVSLDTAIATIIAGKLHAVSAGTVQLRVTSAASTGYNAAVQDKSVVIS